MGVGGWRRPRTCLGPREWERESKEELNGKTNYSVEQLRWVVNCCVDGVMSWHYTTDEDGELATAGKAYKL